MRDNLSQGMNIQQAVEQAMKWGIENGILTDLLSRCRTEVIMMLLEEYDAEQVLKYREKETEDRTFARYGKLVKILLGQKKYDDLEKVAEDHDYRRTLFDRYGI